MNEITDIQLLKSYAERRHDPAFTELVRRHVDFVYSVALRIVRDPHLAQDVSQGVFVALARDAGALSHHPVLAGWLHRTTRNIAAQIIRTEARRRAREQQAAAMNDLLAPDAEPMWDLIAPQLDAALAALSETDRNAILLRYFDKATAPDIAAALGISAEAAQKRVVRGLDRLRDFFSKRNLAIGTGSLVLLLSARATSAAPAGLAAVLARSVLSGTISQTAAIAATKAITMTTLQKSFVTLALATTLGVAAFEAHQVSTLRAQNTSLSAQIAAVHTEQPAPDPAIDSAQNLPDPQFHELLKLRGEVGLLRQQAAEVVTLRKRVKQLEIARTTAVAPQPTPAKTPEQEQEDYRKRMSNAKQGALAVCMFSNDNQNTFPTNFDAISRYLKPEELAALTNNFDLVFQGSASPLTNLANTILLAEKVPSQSMETGNWIKIYALADGHAETQSSPDGNFTEWEKAHTYVAPPTSAQ